MLTQLKKELLNHKDIINLIYYGKVDLILVGGSRILSLDSPSSDCDIIIFTKNMGTHAQNEWVKFELPSFKNIHYKLVSIENILKEVSEEYTKDYLQYFNLFHLCLGLAKPDTIIYQRPFVKYFLNTIQQNLKPLICLSLSKLLEYSRAGISLSFNRYQKSVYHYLSFYYLINNYITTSTLEYTQEQKDLLINCKTSKKIPSDFEKLFTESHTVGKYTCMYSYNDLWKELKIAYEYTNPYK